MARLRELSAATSVKTVRESILWGRECFGCPNSWDDFTELVLPCLTSGIVRADSDTQGRACYTPATGIAEPPEIVVSVTQDDDFDDLYLKSFHDERAMLETLETRDPHECIIPLPATGWGWSCYFPKENTNEK